VRYAWRVRLILVLVMVGACSTPTERAVPPSNSVSGPRASASPYSRACPLGIRSSVPWAQELFPGCSPFQIEAEGFVCDGPCPTPCRARIVLYTDLVYLHAYEYDDRGRWLSTTVLATPTTPGRSGVVVLACTYDGDRLANCTGTEGPVRLDRDAQGRLIRVEGGGDFGSSIEPASFKYDGLGRVAEIQAATLGHRVFAYDQSGRLITEKTDSETFTYVYDEQGRLTRYDNARQPSSRGTYSYDASTGRRIRIETTAPTFTVIRSFEYDARGRPTRAVETGATPQRIDFDYCGQ